MFMFIIVTFSIDSKRPKKRENEKSCQWMMVLVTHRCSTACKYQTQTLCHKVLIKDGTMLVPTALLPSLRCKGFLKRVSCFYRCSPDAARWPHPHRRSYIQAVPLCHSFCRDW